MLRVKEMKKLVIVAPKSYQSKIISKLYEMQALHIIEHSKSDRLDIGKPLHDSPILAEALVKVRSVISNLAKFKHEKKYEKNNASAKKDDSKNMPTKQIVSSISELYDDITSTLNLSKEIELELRSKTSMLAKANLLNKMKLDPASIKGLESIAYFIGQVEKPHDLEKEIKSITGRSYFKTIVTEGKSAMAIFIDRRERQNILPALEKHRFQNTDFTEIEKIGAKEADTAYLEKDIAKLETKRQSLEKKLASLSKKHGYFLAFAERAISDEVEKAESPLKFASTEETVIVSGWVPAVKIDSLISSLDQVTNGKMYIEVKVPDHHHDNVPIKLDNPKPVDSFEMLMHLFSLPQFKEIDPTFFMFLTFPIFFGFMLGDFGYGLVTLILFLVLKKTMPQFKGFFNILIFSSIATMIFGMVFGEFFGFEEIMGFQIPHILSRSHQVMDLLTWAIIIGIVHVNVGLFIGFYNEWVSHGLYTAAMEKLSWVVLEVGIAIGYFESVWVGAIVAVIAVIMLWLGEGVKGLIEIPSIFSNILSYARLMAIGLASVKLAEVINEFATEFIHAGGISILYAVLLLLVGHVINIALGIIGPFLHSLRLHYVEFFTKFFHGGGKEYRPFGYRADIDYE